MNVLFTARRGLAIALIACASGLLACNESSTSPSAEALRRVGVLQLDLMADAARLSLGDTSGPIVWNNPPGAGIITAPKVIEVADTVQVGQPVPVVVNTILPDGCWTTDGQDVTQSGLLVGVTPQDLRSAAPICTMIYAWGAHRFTVTFATAGTAKIRVNGRRVRQGDQTTSEPVFAERTVVVR